MPKKLTTPKIKSSAIKQQQDYAESVETLSTYDDDDIETADLEELGEIIINASQAVSQHLMSALQAALVAGRALLAARNIFNYDRNVGGFRGWIEEKGLSRPTAYRYIQLAEHIDLVSQAETLSEAQALILKYKAEHSTEDNKPEAEIRKLRATLKFQPERFNKLEAIAAGKGLDCSDLISEVLDRWLSRQKIGTTVDVDIE